MSGPWAAAVMVRSRGVRAAILCAAALIVLAPVLVASAVSGVIATVQRESCLAGGLSDVPAGGGPLAEGRFAVPLRLEPGRSYEVGATEYGGPGDPTSGSFGAIGDPSQSYLPAHPDTFAELSLLASNPADHGSFSFGDADALGRLPYMTALRVTHAGRSVVLYKRDVGYGQGPGERIANGQPYRLDIWWRAARALGVSKDAVTISLAAGGGAAATLGALPETAAAEPGGGSVCPAADGAGAIPLPLTAGSRTRILPGGLAAAGVQTPAPVRAMVAAGNRLHTAGYLYGGGHGSSLDTLQPAYDCSSAVSYVLHGGGVLGSAALDSTGLASYGLPGPGRWVSIYANSAHAFMYVAGLRFDTVFDAAYDTGPNAGVAGPRWRVSPTVPGWASWTVRHPPGL